MRDIAGYFQIVVSHDGDHKVTPAEFDTSLDELAAASVPIDEDRNLIWERFAARRAQYEPALLGLAALVVAASAPWSSDRSPPVRLRPIFRQRRFR